MILLLARVLQALSDPSQSTCLSVSVCVSQITYTVLVDTLDHAQSIKSETLMPNILETNRVNGSCPIGSL